MIGERIAMLGIFLVDKKINAWIRSEPKVIETVGRLTRLKWQWVVHIARVNNGRWTEKILEWTSQDSTKSRGRPPTNWTDSIKRLAGF